MCRAVPSSKTSEVGETHRQVSQSPGNVVNSTGHFIRCAWQNQGMKYGMQAAQAHRSLLHYYTVLTRSYSTGTFGGICAW